MCADVNNNIEITIKQLEHIPQNVNNHYRREIPVIARLISSNKKPISEEVIEKYFNELNKIKIEIQQKPSEISM